MKTQEDLNYQRIATAIEYITSNFRHQPNLEQIAEKANLSPFHFQKLFAEWAGTTPKKFLQYVSTEYAKKILKENQATLAEAAFETGLSSTSRLHDLFITIEGMTPAAYKSGGKDLQINYSFAETTFGRVIVAATEKGVCLLSFEENEAIAIEKLLLSFPNASLTNKLDQHQQSALAIFQGNWQELRSVKLHLKGSDFQLKVWQALLKIPMGKLYTYGNIAGKIDLPHAARAVGTAIGNNPVAFLIPCHRVIQATGALGGYLWGTTRKTAMIAWEGAKINS
jgi:AraC family transcriptional regulator of adaptative response/methylated-DNA-[protein]-cysteine methyltransferase